MARNRDELIGESLREIGILMLVFVPLDTLLRPLGPPHWAIAAILTGFGFIMIVVGIWIEAGK
jgi:hypothetical protein